MRDLTPEECEIRNGLSTQPSTIGVMNGYAIFLDWGKCGCPNYGTPEWEIFAEKTKPQQLWRRR
jgi:hypothetical protein